MTKKSMGPLALQLPPRQDKSPTHPAESNPPNENFRRSLHPKRNMCTGLVAICICNHYQVLRWVSRCPEQCSYPTNRMQIVDFQCSTCDTLDQAILELEIAAQAQIRTVSRATNEEWEKKKADTELKRDVVRRLCFIGEMTIDERDDREIELELDLKRWEGRTWNKQLRREREIREDMKGKVERLNAEYRERLRELVVRNDKK